MPEQKLTCGDEKESMAYNEQLAERIRAVFMKRKGVTDTTWRVSRETLLHWE